MLKTWAWAIVKPLVKGWLLGRALVIPQSQIAAIAARAGVTSEQVLSINAAIVSNAGVEFDKFKP